MPEALRPTSEVLLATGFSRQVERWALATGAPQSIADLCAVAARQLALACAGGDVCIDVDTLDPGPNGPAAPDSWRDLLLASGVVGTDLRPQNLPLVLDGAGRLYLHRYFDYERRLAQRLLGLRESELLQSESDQGLRALLDQLFGPVDSSSPEPDWQRIAVAMALASRLVVVSGGPGTGKTTMVVNLIACLLSADPATRVALVAPTGKAAARMTEAIRGRTAHLPAPIAERMPAQASTIHRLLGVSGADGRFVHDAGNPLAVDLVVVDEASMLDLALAVHLLEAVPAHARVVLLGDKDQLSAVESGAVFSDLSAAPALDDGFKRRLAMLSGTPAQRIEPASSQAPVSIPNTVVWFTRNFRFARESGIGRLADNINRGDAQAALETLRQDDGNQLRWLDADDPQQDPLGLALDKYAGYIDAVSASAPDPERVFDAFGRFRVLAAVREGERGVARLNAALSERIRRRLAPTALGDMSGWFAGRAVMVLRNDYALRLFNGDIGIALPDANGELMVHFPLPGGGFRQVAATRLPPIDTAFAMTIHKSQGSEFDEVLVMLPRRGGRVLSRELLYTAITRARSRAAIFGSAAVLRAALERRTERRSGLVDRLRELAAQPDGRADSPAAG